MPDVLLTIDPGQKGALALFDTRGHLVAVRDMPDTIHAIAAIVHDWRPDLAIVERAQSMPHQGVTSSFRYGTHYGSLLGVLAGRLVPYETVPPAAWKRALGLGADKTAARRRACELWPDFARDFARVKDDGRAEAALIGHWHLTKGSRP